MIFLSGLLMLPLAEEKAKREAYDTLAKLEAEFELVINEQSYLLNKEYQERRCNDVLLQLRKGVFQSNFLKEIALFNPDYEIFCSSNNGDTSFFLYTSIINRLKENGKTLSYTKSKFSQEKSVALMFNNVQGYGISVLTPPRYIKQLIQDQLQQYALGYQVYITSRLVGEKRNDTSISTFTIHSKKFPLTLKVITSSWFYLYYAGSHLWIALLIASFISILYVFRRQKKIEKNSLEYSLQDALRLDHFEVHYQPIMDSRKRKIVGCEALLRWNDPVQGSISPSIFIPLAEKINLTVELTHLVISNVSNLIYNHPNLFQHCYISINISRSVILQEAFIKQVCHFFQTDNELAKRIVFEITEDNNFSDDELVVLKEHLKAITDVGIRIAVDDFGTGYSGLDFLRQFNFDFVKIDRVFVTNLSDDSTLIPLLQSVKTLTDNLHMKVIVEGVEEKEQLIILNRLGFQYIQGFYYYKPMPKIELIKLFLDIYR